MKKKMISYVLTVFALGISTTLFAQDATVVLPAGMAQQTGVLFGHETAAAQKIEPGISAYDAVDDFVQGVPALTEYDWTGAQRDVQKHTVVLQAI